MSSLAAVPRVQVELKSLVTVDVGGRSWCERYACKHRMRRVTCWPAGLSGPKKVRVYWRNDHWLLQWWEPSQRKNMAQRVDGDLVDAVAKAREIDRRLNDFKTSGRVSGRISHQQLVNDYLEDLQARCQAGHISPRTVTRLTSALCMHYLPFTQQSSISHKFPYPSGINRQFRLDFEAFLASRQVSPNGLPGSVSHKMKSGGFVLDTVRAMYQWAADPDRGKRLAEGFRNPFLRCGDQRKISKDPFGEPDITMSMACQLLEACDAYQLRLFSILLLYGLRASEPVYLFGELIDAQWMRVQCIEPLLYTTKGKRDKRLPMFDELSDILGPIKPGLLILRRSVAEGKERPRLLGQSMMQLAEELQRRLAQNPACSIAQKLQIRDQVLADAGATSYDRIDGEFRELARKLKWPPQATLKDLRHLFATSLAAAGMVECYRQYLMGHATTSAAIAHYTHLNRLKEQYQAALKTEFAPLLSILSKTR